MLDISVRTLRNKLNEYHGHTEHSGSGSAGSGDPALGEDSGGDGTAEARAAAESA